MASNTRRRKTKLDSSLSEEKLLKENKYFDLSFDDLTLFLLGGAIFGPNNLKQSGISVVL